MKDHINSHHITASSQHPAALKTDLYDLARRCACRRRRAHRRVHVPRRRRPAVPHRPVGRPRTAASRTRRCHAAHGRVLADKQEGAVATRHPRTHIPSPS